MKLALLIATSLLPLLLCATAQAQPRKCTAADGKVTYSDVACPERTASERPLTGTLQSPGLRDYPRQVEAAIINLCAVHIRLDIHMAAADSNSTIAT